MAAFNQRYDEIEETFSNPNLLINGDFQIWQMGTSFNASGYTADRWFGTNANLTEKSDSGIKITHNSTVTDTWWVRQYIENTDNLVGQKITISAKVKKSRDFSCNIRSCFPTEINVQVPYSEGNWVTVSITLTVAKQTSGYASVGFVSDGTLQNGDILEIAWVKLELGNVATPFIPRPYAEELALCQRFTLKNGPNTGMYGGVTGSYIFVTLNTPTSMRAIPGIKLGESTTFSARGINGVSALDKESLIVHSLVSTSVVLRFSNPNTTNFPNGTPVTAFSSGDAWYLSAEL